MNYSTVHSELCSELPTLRIYLTAEKKQIVIFLSYMTIGLRDQNG